MRSRSRAVFHRAYRKALGAAVAVFCLLLVVAPAWGQASGDWLQAQGGAEHPGTAEGPAPPLREVWRFDPGISGRFGLSTPLVLGTDAITVGPRALYGVNIANGDMEWRIERALGPSVAPAIARSSEGAPAIIFTEGWGPNPPDEGFASGSPGPSSTEPTPSAGESGAGGEFDSRVVAVEPSSGKRIWDGPVQLDAVSRSGVTVDGGTAYVGDEGGTLTAIDTETGAVRWTYEAPGPIDTTPAVSEGTVVFSTLPGTGRSAFVIAVQASDGGEAWRFQPATVPFIATIPTLRDGLVYLGFSDRTVRAIAIDSGEEMWNSTVNSQFTTASAVIATSEAIYAVDALSELYAFDPTTGKRVWDYALNAGNFRAAPVLSGGSVVVTTERGSILAVDTQSRDLVSRAAAPGFKGFVGSMALTPELVIAVKGGRAPGLVAFVHDPDGVPLAEPSPTVLVPGTMLLGFALAAIPLVALLLLSGRQLRARLGPAFPEDDEDEPEDAWEGRFDEDDDEDEDDDG